MRHIWKVPALVLALPFCIAIGTALMLIEAWVELDRPYTSSDDCVSTSVWG